MHPDKNMNRDNFFPVDTKMICPVFINENRAIFASINYQIYDIDQHIPRLIHLEWST